VPPARPEHQDIHVAPSRVSISPRFVKHEDVWWCGGIGTPNVFSVRIV
jgi:hypothetical protein